MALQYTSRCLLMCLLVTVSEAATLGGYQTKEAMTVFCGYSNTDPVIIRYEGDVVGLYSSVDPTCKSEQVADGIFKLTIRNRAKCNMTRFHESDTWVVDVFIQSVDETLIMDGDTKYIVTCDYAEPGEGVSDVHQVTGTGTGTSNDGFDDEMGGAFETGEGQILRMEDTLGNHMTHVLVGQEVRVRVIDQSPFGGSCTYDGESEEAMSSCITTSEKPSNFSIDCNVLARGVFRECNALSDPQTFIEHCENVNSMCNESACGCDPDAAWELVCGILAEYVCQCDTEFGVHLDWLPYTHCPMMKKKFQIMSCEVIDASSPEEDALMTISDWCSVEGKQALIVGNWFTSATPYVVIPDKLGIEYVQVRCDVYSCENTTNCTQSCMNISQSNEHVRSLNTDRIHIHPAVVIVDTSGSSNDAPGVLSDGSNYVNKDLHPIMLDNCSVTSPRVLPYLIVIIILAISVIVLIIAIIFLVRRLRARETMTCGSEPQPYVPTWPPRQDPRKYDVRFAHGRPPTYRGASSTAQAAPTRPRSYYRTSAPSPPRETESVAESEIEESVERMRSQLEGILPSTSGVSAAPRAPPAHPAPRAPSAPRAPPAPPMPAAGTQAAKSLSSFDSEAGPSRPDISETSIKL